MKNNSEKKNRLEQKFYTELLPMLDFEKILVNYGKKFLERGEYIKAKNIFDDVLYVNPENSEAKELYEEAYVHFLKKKGLNCSRRGHAGDKNKAG